MKPKVTALRDVDRLIKEGYTPAVDVDLASYFDTFPHDALMARVEEQVIDGGMLDLILGWLTADILNLETAVAVAAPKTKGSALRSRKRPEAL